MLSMVRRAQQQEHHGAPPLPGSITSPQPTQYFEQPLCTHTVFRGLNTPGAAVIACLILWVVRPAGIDGFPVHIINGTFAGFGFPGSPIATATTMWFQMGSFCLFCFSIKQFHKKYWSGWTCTSFRKDRVSKYLKIVVPMTLGTVS